MVDFISSGIRLGQMCDLSRDVVAGLPVISCWVTARFL